MSREHLTTFQQHWERTVAAHPDAAFLLFADPDRTVQWTYAGFDDVVARVAGTLRDHGVGAGSAVHLVLRNCPAFVAVWLAAARLGAWIVPVDPASTARDVASQVRRTGPVVGICAAGRADVYREGVARSGSATSPRVLELTETAGDVAAGAALVAGAPVTGADDGIGPATRLAVMFTSGTTSEPKGVVLTQENYAVVAETMAAAADLRAGHRWLVTLPLFHANAQYYCFAPAIAVGAGVALTPTFSASGWVRQARELAATHASLFAAPIRMILARTPDGERAGLEHVWFAQSLGAEHYARFADLVGCRPRQLYGMTETVAVVTADQSPDPGHDVIGTPVAGRVVEVEDPVAGGPVAPGEPGVLVVRGVPGVDLFAGYLDDERTTARVFRRRSGPEVGFVTGDLVAGTPGGAMRFVGRVDDVIKVSGENVSLTEVEAVLAQAPGVLEVAVLGIPDPVRDRVPVAYVVAKDPADPPSAQQLGDWAAQHLTPAARPREWHLIAELPRTSVGKVRRFRIGT